MNASYIIYLVKVLWINNLMTVFHLVFVGYRTEYGGFRKSEVVTYRVASGQNSKHRKHEHNEIGIKYLTGCKMF